jgi:O-antigen ligase
MIILITTVIGATLALWVPDAVWSRMTFSTQAQEQEDKLEGRALVYTAAVKYFPEYAISGVGAGNFWGPWGHKSRFSEKLGVVSGSHNSFIQITIYWGLLSLLALTVLIWQAYRCLPKQCGNDVLALSLLGISVSILMYLTVVHTLYAKEFSLALGLLVGAHRWIWPEGVVPPASQPQRLFRLRGAS